MNGYKILLAATGALATGFIDVAVAADKLDQTGSRVDSDATQIAVLQLQQSSTIDEVQQLLDQGRIADAIKLAREYVDRSNSHRSVGEGDVVPEAYFALNALCIALTKNRDYDEAIASCDRAIQIQPRRWSAINNRGTARFAAQQYEAALGDYRLALSVAPEDPAIRDTIMHNIALAEARIASRN
jgi:tetratricopeptide (TPR) repeat protein